MGRGDLPETGPILLRVLATTVKQIPPLTNSPSLSIWDPILNPWPYCKSGHTYRDGKQIWITSANWPLAFFGHAYLIKDNLITYILRIYCTFVFNVKIVKVSTIKICWVNHWGSEERGKEGKWFWEALKHYSIREAGWGFLNYYSRWRTNRRKWRKVARGSFCPVFEFNIFRFPVGE